MAFTINLYNVSDDPRKLNKTLGNPIEVTNVRPTDIVDLMNPSFILDYNENYTTKNYLYASAPFDRFYFITDMKIDIGKKIVISCAVDVLQTYATNIGSITADVIRQENKKDVYLADSDFNIKAGFVPIVDIFTGGAEGEQFTSGKYIFSWIGGPSDNYVLVASEPDDWEIDWGSYYIYRNSTGAYELLSSVYPSTSSTPSFNTVYRTFQGIYTLID